MILVNFLLGCIELGFRILISPDFPLGFVLQNDFLVTLHNLRDELEPGQEELPHDIPARCNADQNQR